VEVEIETPSVVGPGAKLEVTALDVKRKIEDVNGAGASEDDRGQPENSSVILHHRHGVSMFFESLVSTAHSTEINTLYTLVHNPLIYYTLVSLHYTSYITHEGTVQQCFSVVKISKPTLHFVHYP